MTLHNMSKANRVLVLVLLAMFTGWTTAGRFRRSTDPPIYVFSNLQRNGSNLNILPVYPVGEKLELSCFATQLNTFWYEGKGGGYKELPSQSFNVGSAAHGSIYTHKLTEDDDGARLACFVESTSKRRQMKLSVIGPPDYSVDVLYGSEKIKLNGNEEQAFDPSQKIILKCSAFNWNKRSKLCWFKDGVSVTCSKTWNSDEKSVHVLLVVSKMSGTYNLTCRGQLKNRNNVNTLKKEVLEKIHALFSSGSVTVNAEAHKRTPDTGPMVCLSVASPKVEEKTNRDTQPSSPETQKMSTSTQPPVPTDKETTAKTDVLLSSQESKSEKTMTALIAVIGFLVVVIIALLGIFLKRYTGRQSDGMNENGDQGKFHPVAQNQQDKASQLKLIPD